MNQNEILNLYSPYPKGVRRILKLTWIEFFLRNLPEAFIYILGIHIVSRKYFNILRLIFLSIVLSLTSFFVRWLPIYLGVHMIINIILTISIMAITGIPIIKSIYSTLLVYFMLSLSEFFNLILLNLLNINMEFSNPVTKCLLGIPSLIFLLLFIMIFNYAFKRKEDIKKCL
ncbi:hypothetical protein CLPUN_52270 [Clostridium puniceum]|uniref:Uncharacterized protein n=1 Tax=Clostridium puniceum TaxID=29367 RepID=A0A1S8SY28_9CLOT|nr:hypothetical protein CLPUN_52270 [Clostridium puniceum]